MGSIHSYTTAGGRRYRISYHKPNGRQATLRQEAAFRCCQSVVTRQFCALLESGDLSVFKGSRGTKEGGPRGARTHDPRIKSPMLYRLS